MLAKTLLFASVATLAVAQTATSSAASSASSCGSGQLVLDSCMGTIQAQLNSCESTDYSCLCNGYTAQVGCYASAGCPNLASVSTAQQLRALNCNNASIYSSLSAATATSTSTRASSASAAATSVSAAASSVLSSASSAASSARASATGTTNGAQNVKAAGGLLAAVAAGVCMVL